MQLRAVWRPRALSTFVAIALLASSCGGQPTRYSFERMTTSGLPVAWSRCRPIPVEIAGATAETVDTLRNVEAQVSQATGYQFLNAETFEGYGIDARWEFAPAGALGQVQILGIQNGWFTDVLILIDQSRLSQGYGQNSIGATLLHEFGHAMGLGHSDLQSQVMFESSLPGMSHPGYGYWDKIGLEKLAAVGRSACPNLHSTP